MKLKALFVSKVRAKLLRVFLLHPGEIYHVRGLVRKTGEQINAVRRELARMAKFNMVKKEPRGNRLYYWFDDNYLFYPELVSMITKTSGLGGSLLKNKGKLGKINFVMFSGRFACGLPKKKDNEVEVLVVGTVNLPQLESIIKQVEKERAQEINYSVMEKEEFIFRKKRRDPFILEVLMSSRVMIIGSQESLLAD
ncbi:hypothetical protein MUP65_01330 [Patescibacteria group bacterium]|nr:hypothetical protein [Patescibacteria group bacterium]